MPTVSRASPVWLSSSHPSRRRFSRSSTTRLPADCGAATPLNCDTAVFLGPQASYTITPGAGGKVVVTQVGAVVAPQKTSDGVDTLSNIEQVTFSDGTVALAVPAAPVVVSAI